MTMSGQTDKKTGDTKLRNAAVCAAVFAAVLLLILLAKKLLLTPEKAVGVNPEVLQYRSEVEEACREQGIGEYAELMLAMMQQESGGLLPDVFQCSESPFNLLYERSPNAIDDPAYSISVAAETFAYCLERAQCGSIRDKEGIKIALQEYNFGNDYSVWARENYGKYTPENAEEFSLNMQTELGWEAYGDPLYAEHVLQYYQEGD